MNEKEQAAIKLGVALGEAIAIGLPKETITAIVDGAIALCSFYESFVL